VVLLDDRDVRAGAEAAADAAAYESWSRFCLEKIDSLLSKAAAARA
jgi:hypothetical protein